MAAAFYADMATGDTEQIYNLNPEPEPHGYAEDRPRPVIVTPIAEAAPMIDAAIEPPDRPLIDPEKPDRGDTLNTGPPKADEWLDFFSRIVLKIGIRLYTDVVFRGVDETTVSDADIQRLQVKKQERDTIARPFAEFATKNKYLRKHGREVVALTDSLESLMTLGILLRRINRVAAKYKKNKPLKVRAVHVHQEAAANGDNGQNSGDSGIGGSANGRIPHTGYGIYNPGSG